MCCRATISIDALGALAEPARPCEVASGPRVRGDLMERGEGAFGQNREVSGGDGSLSTYQLDVSAMTRRARDVHCPCYPKSSPGTAALVP